MRKKIYTRPVSVTLPEEVFKEIKAITDERDIGISDYIREAIEEKMAKHVKNRRNES